MKFSLRRTISALTLTAAWCFLWGNVSFANVASGLFISAFVTSPTIHTPGRGTIRLGPLVQLGALIFKDLVLSTVEVARETITPTDHTNESIIRVELQPSSSNHFLLIASAITLTPGTAVIDTDADTGEVYIHLLHHRNRDATIDHVHRLADLAARALPVDEYEASL